MELSNAPETSTPLESSPIDVEFGVFRAYESGEFVEWPTWEHLQSVLLSSNGGSYGLSGPRGAGKSWLMMRALEWAKAPADGSAFGGIGLWYPSPSEHQSLNLLASLTDSFATEIDRWFRRSENLRRDTFKEAVGTAMVGAAVAAGVAILFTMVRGIRLEVVAAIALGLAVGAIAGITARYIYRLRFSPCRHARRLAGEAKVVRERARFSATRREGTEFAAEGAHGLGGRAARSRQRELVERPATLSSLVNDFRALTTEAGEVSGRVVIAIDELDKMSSSEDVRALLRDIKGIFEVPKVHFLVSVSDEAARNLSLGALSGRNEFNSSFYTVIEVAPATPEQIADLLERRAGSGVQREVALALAVLAGGNPREAVRYIDLARRAESREQAAASVLEHEALTLRREIVTDVGPEGGPSLSTEERVSSFTDLPEDAFALADRLAALASKALSQPMWTPAWEGEPFRSRFGESWRRLMIRLAVAQVLIEGASLVRDPDLGLQLRDVIVAATQSAEVGRIVFEQKLRVDTRRPFVRREQARRDLTDLARQYEQIRGSEGKGAARTANLDKVVADARRIARDAELTSDEVRAMLRSASSGDRVVALAVIQTTGDPEAFESVLTVVANPPTPFESYAALLATETLLRGLSEEQAGRVREVVTETVLPRVDRRDSARIALCNRILASLADRRRPAPTAAS